MFDVNILFKFDQFGSHMTFYIFKNLKKSDKSRNK